MKIYEVVANLNYNTQSCGLFLDRKDADELRDTLVKQSAGQKVVWTYIVNVRPVNGGAPLKQAKDAALGLLDSAIDLANTWFGDAAISGRNTAKDRYDALFRILD